MEDEELYSDTLITINQFVDLCERKGISEREAVLAVRDAIIENDIFDFSQVAVRRLRLRRPGRYFVFFNANQYRFRNGVNIENSQDEYLFPLKFFVQQFDQGSGMPRIRPR